jgi:hypothetical protein
MTYTESFEKILEIIDFQEDRKEFINTFTLASMKEAAAQLILALPSEKKSSFQNTLSTSDTIEKLNVLLAEYLSEDEFKISFQKVLQKNFLAFLETIRATLTPEKQNELGTYIASLQNIE